MASWFVVPKTPKPPIVKDRGAAEQAKATINRERRRASGTYGETIAGSGLKPNTGA